MVQRYRRGFTSAERTEMWDRWQRGESLRSIGRAFGKPSSSIYFQVAPHGGIRPPPRRRSKLALTLSEREEISRGIKPIQIYPGSPWENGYNELFKPQCTTAKERRVSRDVNQEARDYTQSLMGTEAYGESVIGRKQIERLFGEAKRHLAMTRLRLRGPTGARDEFLLTATVQNLKRLVERLAIPPPRTIHA